MTTSPFWFVWNPLARIPQYRHPRQADAVSEAERLARQHPGQEFIVLQSVCSRRVAGMEYTDLRPQDECPF